MLPGSRCISWMFLGVALGARAHAAAADDAAVALLGPERATRWSPGVRGGIPARNKVCRTVSPPAAGDATELIGRAIEACPSGQVVQLTRGTFNIDGGNFLLISKGITLRGAGPGQTILRKTDGARPGEERPGPKPSPLIIVGPARWHVPGGRSADLTADAVKGGVSVKVVSTAGFAPGMFVLIDELSGAGWRPDPLGRGKIWASSDLRVVWQRHDPPQPFDDPFPDAAQWFSRADRPINEIKEIAKVSGNILTFTTPFHASYRTSLGAQVSSYPYKFTQHVGIEDLTVTGGDDGNIRFLWAANSWAKQVENSAWFGEGFALNQTFGIEIRDSYVHDAVWAQPGGAGYALSMAEGTSEALVENSIIVKANKVMVARSAGTASVIAYNYVDDGYINTNTRWIEVGLNASHMVGSHHVLFEGNYGFNWDSDKTHGNATTHTIFRNHLTGRRRDFDDDAQGHGPLRCAGATAYSYWHAFVGNVLGVEGRMKGWAYESGKMTTSAVFLLGWDEFAPYNTDPRVKETTLRHGNYDFLTQKVAWDPAVSERALPSSLYLDRKPAAFSAGRGYVWPWVDPIGTRKLYELPAKVRFDAGTPFTQP